MAEIKKDTDSESSNWNASDYLDIYIYIHLTFNGDFILKFVEFYFRWLEFVLLALLIRVSEKPLEN